jgi:VWFA-related protein
MEVSRRSLLQRIETRLDFQDALSCKNRRSPLKKALTLEKRMRGLIWFALFLLIAFRAGAEAHLTVAQFEEVLTKATIAHKSDSEFALRIGTVELSERLSETTVDRLTKRLTLDNRVAQALHLLADQSEFLDPPLSELPAIAPPDTAAQQRMLNAARNYVAATLSRLPNFLATRTTERFDDSPQALAENAWPTRAGLHLLGASSSEISVRNEQGTMSSAGVRVVNGEEAQAGLTSWGEFGSMLGMILGDVANGNVSWSHWEEAVADPVAVFNYSVPRSSSHFQVTGILPQQFGQVKAGVGFSLQPVLDVSRGTPYHIAPGYHGKLWLDPATGTILRITIEADLRGLDPVKRAATLTEYGPVTIGDSIFICPVHSLALHMDLLNQNDPSGAPPLLELNETKFTNYHRFASTARLLTGIPSKTVNPSSESLGLSASDSQASDPEFPLDTAAASPPTETHTEAAASAPATPETPKIPEFSLSPLKVFADSLAGLPGSQDAQSKFESRPRRVDINAVVYDKRDHLVKNLTSSDFEIYDNGQKQGIDFFSESTIDAGIPPATSATADHVFPNHTAEPFVNSSTRLSTEPGATILLIDEAQVAWKDLTYARDQMLHFLGGLAPGEPVGLYVLTSRGLRVLEEVTADHQALKSQLQNWTPSTGAAPPPQNVSTHGTNNGEPVEALGSNTPIHANNKDDDQNSASSPYARIVLGMARHLALLPGHKNLIWITREDALGSMHDQKPKYGKGQGDDGLVVTLEEAMREARTTIFTLDALQLEAASEPAHAPRKDLTQLAQESIPERTPPGSGSHSGQGNLSADNAFDQHLAPTPDQQHVEHAGMPALLFVAETTGGRKIHMTGDLATSLTPAVEGDNATYTIGFSPSSAADGKSHRMQVKLKDKRGFKVRHSAGYFYANEPDSLKERVQQAIWQPADLTEIGLSVIPVPATKGVNLKLNIDAGDLALKQQNGRWMDSLDVFVAEEDTTGLQLRMNTYSLNLQLTPATYDKVRQEGITRDQFVEEAPDCGLVRILVLDENSGRIGSVTIPGLEQLIGQPPNR